jgi:hypothetical protein
MKTIASLNLLLQILTKKIQSIKYVIKLVVIMCLHLTIYSDDTIAQTAGHGAFQVFAPNTYALGKYGDVPVNLSAGIPQIDLPLLKMTDKDISVDLSLSYHASGIKVDQEASWVGLGWALNAGGLITREVRGLPDGYSYAGTPQGRTSLPDYSSSWTQSNYNNMRSLLNNAVGLNGTDNGADMFYYNFGGRTGKFFFDAAGTPVFTKYEDFKVQLNSSGFTITDDRGVIYEFKVVETTTSLSAGSMTYVSAWYLSKIISPSGGEIIIEYATGGMTTENNQMRCYNQAYFAINGSASVHNLPQQYSTPCFNREATINTIIPKKIKTSTGNYIELTTSSLPRRDSEGYTANQLDFISLFDYNGLLIKKLKLNYSYFEANNARKFPVTGSSDTRSFLNYRLRLDSYQEVSTSGRLGSPYRFEYYGDNDPQTNDVYTLPYRMAPSQDHWGYFNGSSNTSIFPNNPASKPFNTEPWCLELTWSGMYSGSPNFGFNVTGGGTREPDSAATKAGSLRKIIYPTGGYTRFEMAQHGVNGDGVLIAGGICVKQIESRESASGLSNIKNYEYTAYGVGTLKCLAQGNNPYYTWYYHNYNPTISSYGHPDLLAGLGVPYSMAASSANIVRVDGTTQLQLGTGMSAYYVQVKETSPGNGWTIYDYTYSEDQMEGYTTAIDGLATPGQFEAVYMDTYGVGGSAPYFHTINGSSCIAPFPNFINNDWRRGHLLSKSVYS